MPSFGNLNLEATCPAPVCGVDEAGRGPWAGPVSAAAVILDPKRPITGLTDSKALSPKRREALALEIEAHALAYCVAFADEAEIAALNILGATGLAMRRAVAGLRPAAAFALVDGSYAFDLGCAVRPIIRGDAISASIAAASILAKTARDRVMLNLDVVYPGYGFAAHKGYGSAVHAAALSRLGPCAIHRRTFKPVIAAMAGRVDRDIQD